MMKRWLYSFAVLALLAASGPAASAAPPEPVNDTFTDDSCGHELVVHVVGKEKTHELSDSRVIRTSPGEHITVTDPVTGNSLDYVITGSGHETTLPDGRIAVTAVGKNALFHPLFGFIITSGNMRFAIGPDGEFLEPPHGTGNVIDVCKAIL